MLCKRTVIIKKDVIWLDRLDAKCTLEKLLVYDQ